MSIKVHIDLKGMDKVMPQVVMGLKNGLDKIGKMIERDAKIFAPVATGRLRSSITSFRKGNIEIIQDNVHYGIHQEFGTKFMAAQPFMNPALNKNIPLIAKVIENEIARMLK